MKKGKGWYATFALLVVVIFAVIYALTGQDAIGAAARFLWNGAVMLRELIVRTAGGLLKILAQGVGWRRFSRLFSAGASIGLGYAASVIVSEQTVKRARGWRERLRAAAVSVQHHWRRAPLVAKILAVGCLIASQIYLHFFLVIFPIAFLVPTVRRIWVRAADFMFGSWYWKTFGMRHRAFVAAIRNLPLVRPLFEAVRLVRLRYLSAWRLWRYDPRYRRSDRDKRYVNFVEPLRLWWRGELDGYVGRPLLSGPRQPRRQSGNDALARRYAEAQ